MNAEDQPLISIIIPTKNAGSILGDCLEAIRSQSYQNIEIIVVDNYSSDGTQQIAKRCGARVIIAGPPPPRNNFFTAPIQRRIGADHAKGALLFFMDADMILSQGLLGECVRMCKSGVDAITIAEISFGKGF
ncbi:MAG: glycosyltransferase [Nitrososphaeria archaeon]